MTKATNNVARVAAAVAGFGLVAMSFAPAVGAQTTTTTTSTTTTAATFSRDLTLGSTGADVTALQNWLISMKFSIPAGATGYFGAQTKAALAAYQAANGIAPAAGYFGPITRAKVAAAGGSTTSTGGTTTTTTGTLSGGEADFRNFDLQAGDDLSEGDSNTEVAIAKFDVRGGDVNLQRVTVELQPLSGNTAVSTHPWDYVDNLSVYSGSKKIGDIDTSSKSDWDRQTASSGADFTSGADFYSIDIPVSGIIREGNNEELSIRADAASNIDDTDTAQTFTLKIPTDGIRAVDSKGIQEYTGNDSVTLGFNTAQSGDLVVTATSDNPKSQVLVADDQNTSDSFDVLAFQIRNKDDADVDFNKLVFMASTSSTTLAKNVIRKATLDLDGDTYTGTIGGAASTTITFDNLNTSVSGNDSIQGTLSVELFGQSNHFSATGESLTFKLVGNNTNVDAESADNGDTSDVSGTAQGNKMTIGVNTGVTVSGNSNTTSESYNSTTPANSTGTFALKFDVMANGNDVYIPKTVFAGASTTAASDTNSGVVVITDLAASTSSAVSSSASLTSTADTASGATGYYIVHEGDTETFTVNVTIDPLVAGYYQVGLDKVHFNDSATLTGIQTLDNDQTDSDFQTGQLYIH